ncbi:hypothetical protein ACUY3K_03445 [Corynebacterium uberis]|uniref:hypothetical protein n=1 Tax=Corynebacterium TaxID=1716 RepID=UPI001D0BB325|nr:MULTISPECIES: hypothetical protein [Corynebacterium]MCZ9309354.1 hypothetical protein [Corynebacterium sp. c6VSa_13]UDL72903.1 hypothetical protein LH391_07215 [Corynebacterium uberis]UDL76220.1 hypothetical protein LH393_02180 [Corynebacterium uberis]UDL78432.1 hypothetical protein LH394_02170 [Corynebacterium uberis]UDL80715.1 hypothetical protein LH392_02600 [Corynebacterium uberis]
MKFVIIDEETNIEYWTAERCANYCNITRSSWSAYVSRTIAPAPSAHLNARTPLWSSREVCTWHAERPSQQVAR